MSLMNASLMKMTLVAAALAALPAACTVHEPVDATEPTVSFSYTEAEDAEEVAEKADDYCDDRYDNDAYLLDTDQQPGGYEATFACR
ncbi:MAG: hypothetical protein Tsb0032_39770 [Kiloniellaceae bacterium]